MRRRPSNLGRRASPWLAAALVAGLAACEDRERIGPGPGDADDRQGPVTIIREPGAPDTIVTAGPGVFIVGGVTDDTGLDSIYIDVTGGVTTYPPVNEDGSRTFDFALPITTNGQQGELITIRIHGVDLAGNRGEPAIRRILVAD